MREPSEIEQVHNIQLHTLHNYHPTLSPITYFYFPSSIFHSFGHIQAHRVPSGLSTLVYTHNLKLILWSKLESS